MCTKFYNWYSEVVTTERNDRGRTGERRKRDLSETVLVGGLNPHLAATLSRSWTACHRRSHALWHAAVYVLCAGVCRDGGEGSLLLWSALLIPCGAAWSHQLFGSWVALIYSAETWVLSRTFTVTESLTLGCEPAGICSVSAATFWVS